MIRRWMTSFVAFAFLAGLWLCLAVNPTISHHGPGSPLTVLHTAEDCGTFTTVRGKHSGSRALLPSSLLAMDQNTTYEDIPLTPPAPPPRG